MNTKDYGPLPYVVNIEELTVENENFRVTKWTGKNMQMTVMSIEPGSEVGLEVHEDHDQFLRIESGQAKVEIGKTKDDLDFVEDAHADFAVLVPAGMWHNLTNTGIESLKLYSIYAPAEHELGTIHKTYMDDPEHQK